MIDPTIYTPHRPVLGQVDEFWAQPMDRHQTSQMAEKYAWMCATILDGPGPIAPATLREAARRWPGSLRECQRTRPEHYRARAARVGQAAPQSYGEWAARGDAAVCLWSELHRLYADVLSWRRGAPPAQRGRVTAFMDDLAVERRPAWPAIAASSGWRVNATLAERSLALRCGWERSALQRCLWGETRGKVIR